MTVRVLSTVAEFSSALDSARADGLQVGLVPTMGALHDGHRALVERARAECGLVAVTIFVNPLQFNDPSDLEAYPRTLEADTELLDLAGADVVFVPQVSDLYPDHPAPPAVTVEVSGITEMLEGASRPGHFAGVATVVAKLFAMAGRCRAYFGEKDFQQLVMVRRLARDLCFLVEVVGCETVREADGLAISSRNVRLSESERRSAAVLNRALSAGVSAVSSGEDRPSEITDLMLGVLASEPGVDPEYVAVVDPRTLSTPSLLKGEVRLLVAARVGPVRLIDNLGALVGAHIQKEGRAHAMRRRMMKSKIHRATVTGAELDYVGSISLDPELMALADIREHEQVAVLDIDNGARFETYAILGAPGEVCLNGAAARLVHPGDKVIVLTYADYEDAELDGFSPRVVFVDSSNRHVDKSTASLEARLETELRQPAGL
jgi:pantoate--beta-alanine ligase